MANIIPLPTPTFNGQVQNTGLNGYHLPASIDNLFQMYQEGKLREQQLQAGQQQMEAGQAGFRLQNQGLSPQDVNQYLPQAMQPAPMQGSLYSPQGQPQRGGPLSPMDAQTAMQQGAYQPPQEDPRVGVLRNIMAMHLQGAQLGAAKQGAELQKTQEEAWKYGAETQKLNTENAIMGGGVDGGLRGNITGGIQSGKLPPDILNGLRGDMGQMLRLGVTGDLAAQGTNVVGLQNAVDKSNATAKYEGGPDVQGKVRTAQSIIADANELKNMSASMKDSDYQLINKYGLQIAAQKGSVPAQEILDQAKLVADRFQAMIGGGSDAKLELGLDLFNAAKTHKQLARGVARMSESLNNYSSSLQGKGTKESTLAPASGGVNSAATTIIQNGLKAGKSRDQIKAELKAAGH